MKCVAALIRRPSTYKTCPPAPKTPLMGVSPAREGRVDSTPQAARKPELVQLDVGQE